MSENFEAIPDDTIVHIQVIHSEIEKSIFKVKMTTPLSKILSAWSNKHLFPSLKGMTMVDAEGCRLRRVDSVQDAGLKDGDSITVVIDRPMGGGGHLNF